MAAAEARAAWQRANRCFVQEDAKRAPKLSTRPSPTLLSKHADSGTVNGADHPDPSAIGFIPYKGTPYSNLPPGAKWWLQSQPNYVHQFNDRKIDMMENRSQFESSSMCEESIQSIHSVDYEDLESFLDVKKKPDVGFEKLDVVDGKVDQDFLDVKKMTDYYDLIEMEMETVGGGSVSKQSSGFPSSVDSSCVGGDKVVPWWRLTDGEELASFVAHKSLLPVENCDLPPPQKMKTVKESSSGGAERRHWSSVEGEGGLSQKENVADEPLRLSDLDPLDKEAIFLDDPGKAKLLEALCHSQTRAREAENAAKQACTEKDHILKLFFRQASQLFAYKQWFKILQLENLLLQTEDYNPSPPPPLPWKTEKPNKPRKSCQKPSKTKRSKRRSQDNDIGKFAVAFAVGFTLVGAGLILGWTVGWLMPSF